MWSSPTQPAAAADAIRSGKPVAAQDAEILSELPIDVVVEATGNPDIGARVAMRSILARKHVVMLNVETDVVVGPILYKMAQAAGVVYTVSSGDEPGLIAEYYDRYAGLGFEVIAVGKAPSSIGLFDRYATPDSVAEDAKRLGVNPHFLVTFRDATKTMIEMACISNYTGLIPDIRGMHGPVAGVNEIPKLFRPKSEGGILNHRGVVDYARPLKHPDGSIDFDRSVTPGVFLCVYTDHPQIREDLNYLDVTGSDGYYNMYTPYHLVTNEIPLSVVNAVEFGHPTIVPKLGLVTEVFGAAKRPLKAGETIDGAGGSSVYALNDLYEIAKAENVVPLGLLTGAKLRCDVHDRQARHLRYGRRHRQHDPLSPSRDAGRGRGRQIPELRRGTRTGGGGTAEGGGGIGVSSAPSDTGPARESDRKDENEEEMHMLNGLWAHPVPRELARKTLAGVALVGVGLASSYAFAETRSEPYPAWPEPVIQEKMSVDEAKAIVAERTKPQTEWKGPTDGPKAPIRQLHHRLCLARPVVHAARSLGQRG